MFPTDFPIWTLRAGGGRRDRWAPAKSLTPQLSFPNIQVVTPHLVTYITGRLLHQNTAGDSGPHRCCVVELPRPI